MPTPIRAARGVRDLLPAERAAHAVVEHAARESARRFGYQEVELPIVEPVELIERGVGGDSDVAGKELYRLETHGDADGDSGPRLVLRPEATATSCTRTASAAWTRTRSGCWTARSRSASRSRRGRRGSWTTSAGRARRRSPRCGRCWTRPGWNTGSTRSWCAGSTTTRGPCSSS